MQDIVDIPPSYATDYSKIEAMRSKVEAEQRRWKVTSWPLFGSLSRVSFDVKIVTHLRMTGRVLQPQLSGNNNTLHQKTSAAKEFSSSHGGTLASAIEAHWKAEAGANVLRRPPRQQALASDPRSNCAETPAN